MLLFTALQYLLPSACAPTWVRDAVMAGHISTICGSQIVLNLWTLTWTPWTPSPTLPPICHLLLNRSTFALWRCLTKAKPQMLHSSLTILGLTSVPDQLHSAKNGNEADIWIIVGHAILDLYQILHFRQTNWEIWVWASFLLVALTLHLSNATYWNGVLLFYFLYPACSLWKLDISILLYSSRWFNFLYKCTNVFARAMKRTWWSSRACEIHIDVIPGVVEKRDKNIQIVGNQNPFPAAPSHKYQHILNRKQEIT